MIKNFNLPDLPLPKEQVNLLVALRPFLGKQNRFMIDSIINISEIFNPKPGEKINTDAIVNFLEVVEKYKKPPEID
jgi:hypothetical protein